jgi:hypothetical protein
MVTNQRERLAQGFQPAELAPVALVPFNRAENDVGMNPVLWAVDLFGLTNRYLRLREIAGEIG